MTPYAAPPILMVASTWGWDASFVFLLLGWKAILAVIINALLFVVLFRRMIPESFYTLKHLIKRDHQQQEEQKSIEAPIPVWIYGLHFLFLVSLIYFSHHEKVFIGIFIFFLGLVHITKEFQNTKALRLKESLLVAFFLAGIIVFGPFQKWWLQPLLAMLNQSSLYLGATLLTAVTDNAALTYLGSQVPHLTDAMEYALVAGALVGGGLTVIANAPNPAGYAIIAPHFAQQKVNPLFLLLAALLPTSVAFLVFSFGVLF
jgi:uncharacterized membrane protein